MLKTGAGTKIINDAKTTSEVGDGSKCSEV